MKHRTTKKIAEELGYQQALTEFQTQGCFSSFGVTWRSRQELNNAYDAGVARAEVAWRRQVALENVSEMEQLIERLAAMFRFGSAS